MKMFEKDMRELFINLLLDYGLPEWDFDKQIDCFYKNH